MTFLGSVNVGSGGQSAMTFSSISQSYTHLVILWSGRVNRSTLQSDGTFIRFNGDNTSGNYTFIRMINAGGSGNNTSSDNGASYGGAGISGADLATAGSHGSNYITIPNYTSSVEKVFSTNGGNDNNASTTYMQIAGGKWSGTSAITQISIIPEVATTWYQYSTAYLYGLTS